MNRRDSELVVMTQNVYFGANLESVIEADSPAGIVAAAGEAWSNVVASEIPARAEKIAGQIAYHKPDLVGLQEVTQWYFGKAGAIQLEYDFLESILSSLLGYGVRYVPLAIMNDFDQIAPINMEGDFVRLLDRDAILMRVEPPASELQPYNIHSAHFAPSVSLPFGLGSVPRSWIAIDATFNDRRFRLVETHIESFKAETQLAQARELLAGPANTDLPIVMLGDFNSNADQGQDVPDCTPTYPELIAAGLEDVWAAVNPGDPGHTGVQAADLRNEASSLDRRIDLILTRGGFKPTSAELVGATTDSRTASGLWLSDHAGIVATLRIASA
jgi:endonuclease/exonuclease/phosphatase family metal-dependent hydrolase